MDDTTFKKYVDLVLSMSSDCLLDKLDRSTYTSNLGIVAVQIGANLERSSASVVWKDPNEYKENES